MKNLFSIQLVGAGMALLLANACIIVSDDTSDSESETGDGDGDQEVGDGDGDAGDGDGDAGDGDGDAGDGDGDAGDGDGDAGDGDGDAGDAITEACTAACDLIGDCQDEVVGCVEECVEQHLVFADDPECGAAQLALTECIVGLTCEEIAHLMSEEPSPLPCQAELDAICEAPDNVCTVGVGQGEDPGVCDVSVSCGNDPTQYEVVCDGESCTCLEDGVEVGGCAPANEVCDQPGAGAAADCCGFQF